MSGPKSIKRETVKAASACHRSKLGGKKLLRLALSDQSLTVTPGELFDAPGCVDELLFTSEKGMAGGAYTNLHIATSRSGTVDRATSTSNGRLYVIWMDISLHVIKK
jgi:hypothetical protein